MRKLWKVCVVVGGHAVQKLQKLYSVSTVSSPLNIVNSSYALLLHTLSTRFSTYDFVFLTGARLRLYPLSTEPITTTTLI